VRRSDHDELRGRRRQFREGELAQLGEQRTPARAARKLASPGPEEVAPTIALLGSPATTGATGELVRVSGGL
jgi:NAD(P)-dependent dehydrogenase (short-subunit alcohol dehydrogenase family)